MVGAVILTGSTLSIQESSFNDFEEFYKELGLDVIILDCVIYGTFCGYNKDEALDAAMRFVENV